MSDNGTDIIEYQPPSIVNNPGLLAEAGTMALAMMSDQQFAERIAMLKTGLRRIAQIQRDLMIRDVDYGIIPGTNDKYTLLKPGAEKLMAFYRYVAVPHFEAIVGDGLNTPTLRVQCTIEVREGHADGPLVGYGAGAANSFEVKYRWRKGTRICPECQMPTIIAGKEEYGGGFLCWTKKGGCGAKFDKHDPAILGQQLGKIENGDPWDYQNTLVKMALKRAKVDAALSVCAASGLFQQDVEDLEDMEGHEDGQPVNRPQSTPSGWNPNHAKIPVRAWGQAQRAYFFGVLREQWSLDNAGLCELLGVENLKNSQYKDMPMAELLDLIKEKAANRQESEQATDPVVEAAQRILDEKVASEDVSE